MASPAKAWNIQLVITDFEPLSYRVARMRDLPVISIDNQHCLTNAQVSYPRKYRKEAAKAKLVTRLMIPHATAYLATSFFTPPLRHKYQNNTFMMPPILRMEVLRAQGTDRKNSDTTEFLLVYTIAVSRLRARSKPRQKIQRASRA